MSEDSVNVYVRNSQKVGRIIKISAGITAEALYQTAAESHSLAPENIHLYLQGKLIENDQTPCELKEKAIIHLVNNQDLDRETIEIKVKDLNGSQTTSFEVDSSTNIKEFIDSKLPENFGANTEELVLVYIGRQLKSDKSFKEEKV